MKRISSGLVAAVAVVALGVVASACNVGPDAASVNGDTVSVSSLNTQMNALADTAAGACLVALNGDPTVTPGSSYPTAYANKLLGSDVGDILAEQFAVAHGVAPKASDLTTAKTDYTSALDGGISSLNSEAQQANQVSPCQSADGTAYTGAEVLAALPASVRNAEVRNQAVDNLLLARGADLSNKAIFDYYGANQTQFAIDCVSDIATATEADANQIIAKLAAGTSFADLAKSSSIDTQTASGGGSLGCNFTEARVLSALQISSVTPGQPVTPIQTSSGMWVIYEVTSQTLVPVNQAAAAIRVDLIHTTPNTQRVSAELLLFAHRSSITVNPQYGTWTGLQITPPPTPPVRYLQPSYDLTGSAGTSTSAGG